MGLFLSRGAGRSRPSVASPQGFHELPASQLKQESRKAKQAATAVRTLPASGSSAMSGDAVCCIPAARQRSFFARQTGSRTSSRSNTRRAADHGSSPRRHSNALSTAPLSESAGGCFRVTHPFHPWLGREFELVVHRRTWGEDRVFFYDERGRLSALPAAWTDFVSPDPFVKIAASRSLFRAEDLVELVEQVRSLHKKDGRYV